MNPASPRVDPRASPTGDVWLTFARSHLGKNLVSEGAFEGLREIGQQLPGTALGAIEARLVGAGDRVDYSVRLDPQAMLRVVPRLPPSPLTELATAWAEADPRFEPLSALWLEFDQKQAPGPGAPGPGVSDAEGPVPETGAPQLPNPVVCAQLRGRPSTGWIVDTLVPALQGHGMGAERRRQVASRLEALPEGAKPLYVFALTPRPGSPTRIETYGLAPRDMVAYLRRSVSQGAARQVEEILPLVEDGERHHLSVDLLDEGPSPRIGVEVSFAGLPHREPGWRRLFDRLVAAGLCSPEHREAVFAWPGQDRPETAPERWPGGAPGPVRGHAVRCLSHVKLVTRPDHPPEAKVYLLIQHLPTVAGSPRASGKRRALAPDAAPSGGGAKAEVGGQLRGTVDEERDPELFKGRPDLL
ncbi:MAG: hypothetical protein AAGD06_10665 [Acidobacteriota bacterium]